MSLDTIISAEVVNDNFYNSLIEFGRRQDLKNFLEIGSSSGQGSTNALVNGILKRDRNDANLYCMELSRTRFIDLVNAYRNYKYVFPYNLSSVKIQDFPTKEHVIHFYNSTKTNLNNFSIDTVLGWMNQDIDYISEKKLNYNGISFIKSCNQIDIFDFVLIDGSEFTGEAELQYIWGAKVIALDDVNSFKCFAAYIRLANHYYYKLVKQDLNLRNGFAIFERIS
jgi:hypothetical protein